MPDQIGYLNARLHVWRAELLAPESLAAIGQAPDLNRAIALMATSPYGAISGPAHAGEASLSALAARLGGRYADKARKVVEITGGALRSIAGAYFARMDYRSLNTVLKAREIGLAADTILESVLPGPELDLAALRQLAEQRSAEDVLRLVRTWRPPGLRAGLRALDLRLSAQAREIALEQAGLDTVLRSASDDLGEAVRRYVGHEVEALNVMLAVRSLAENPSARTFQTGMPDQGIVLKGSRFATAAQPLAQSPPALAVRRATGSFPPADVSAAERAVDEWLFERAVALELRYNDGLGLLVGYFARLGREIRAIRQAVFWAGGRIRRPFSLVGASRG